ncbi:mpv17-like protein 2 isoform X2 [Symsagittifera roscoffensis]
MRKGVRREWKWDRERSLRLSSMYFLYSPWQTGLYLLMDTFIPGTTIRAIGCKIILDELNAIPLYISFVTILSLREGNTLKESLNRTMTQFWPIYSMDLRVWPAAQCINFLYVGSAFRVTYVNLVTFIWDIFLSYTVHKEPEIAARERRLEDPISFKKKNIPFDSHDQAIVG